LTNNIYSVSQQTHDFCSPNCSAGATSDTLGCKVSCTGLYSDVVKITDEDKEALLQQRMEMVLEMLTALTKGGKS
jgi:hypothetical protein